MSGGLRNRIRVFRAEHRLSQADLAREIGVSRKTISTIEVGRFVPSTIIALRLARRFDVTVEEIFQLADAPTESGTTGESE
ncbi:MAG: helix-turn-helix transcriptional regulator [Pseudomonadota bacterium]